jgi:hypothetical protein
VTVTVKLQARAPESPARLLQCKEPDDEKKLRNQVSVDGLKFVDSMVKLAGFVEEPENGMD